MIPLPQVLNMINVHSNVVTNRPIPRMNLPAGATGVVVHVYPGGAAYEVEFISREGQTLGVETMTADELTPQQLAAIRADADPHLPTGPVLWRADLFPSISAVLHIVCDQEDDGRHMAVVPELPGTMCYGQTPFEAMAKAQALALRVLAERLETGEIGAASFRFQL